jgi:2,3-bisphosphoglycerate-independent phosphoglycerate mutase
MKYILLVGDGMGDLPVPELGDKTPLEAARKPAIDRLAREGELLLTCTVPEGFPPGSDVANLSLLGYEPEKYYTGRAPLEAASMGISIGADEIAFRCNLVTVDRGEDGTVVMRDHSAGHISTAEAKQLIGAIQDRCGSPRIHFYPGVSYRHLMIHRDGTLPLHTVPPHDYLDRDVTEYHRQYMEIDILREVMEESTRILAEHPVNRERRKTGRSEANSIWLWGEGKPLQLEPFRERHGLTGSLISAVDLLKGIGISCGFEAIQVEGATGYLDTNYEGKAQAALDALSSRDFVLVHVEAPDEAGHQGLAREKTQAIEDFDARIVGPIVTEMERRGEPFRLVVTMDHYTPVSRRTHESWPVPMVLYDTRLSGPGSGRPYTEKGVRESVEKSGLSMVSGSAFMEYFLYGSGRK